MFKFGFTAILALLLSACASFPSGMATQQLDHDYAFWIRDAKSSIALRTNRIDPASETVAALKQACAQGRLTQVVVWVGSQDQAETFKGTCVRVYAHDHPDLQFGQDVLLNDGVSLIRLGAVQAVNNDATRREYQVQTVLRQTGYRVF